MWFILLSMFVHYLFVFDFLFVLFRVAVWPSAGKALTSWLSTSVVLLYAVFIICVPFLFGVSGRMWNSMASVPDHCLFSIYSFAYNLQRK